MLTNALNKRYDTTANLLQALKDSHNPLLSSIIIYIGRAIVGKKIGMLSQERFESIFQGQ